MSRYDYMILPIDIIMQEAKDEYPLMDQVKNGFIVCEIGQGLYGILHA